MGISLTSILNFEHHHKLCGSSGEFTNPSQAPEQEKKVHEMPLLGGQGSLQN